jgi:hypothetical protein
MSFELWSAGEKHMTWRVIYAETIRQRVFDLGKRQITKGRLQPFLDAINRLHDDLERDPLTAGEPHNDLKHLGLVLCIATRKPLFVRYAVDQARGHVYLRQIEWQDD